MREHIIVTQKTMKGLRDFILESPDSPISGRVHDALEGLIQQNRRANYRVEPPPALAAHLRLDDGRVAPVVELSRTHLNFRLTGALPERQATRSPASSSWPAPRSRSRAASSASRGTASSSSSTSSSTSSPPSFEGYLTRVQMFDFLV